MQTINDATVSILERFRYAEPCHHPVGIHRHYQQVLIYPHERVNSPYASRRWRYFVSGDSITPYETVTWAISRHPDAVLVATNDTDPEHTLHYYATRWAEAITANVNVTELPAVIAEPLVNRLLAYARRFTAIGQLNHVYLFHVDPHEYCECGGPMWKTHVRHKDTCAAVQSYQTLYEWADRDIRRLAEVATTLPLPPEVIDACLDTRSAPVETPAELIAHYEQAARRLHIPPQRALRAFADAAAHDTDTIVHHIARMFHQHRHALRNAASNVCVDIARYVAVAMDIYDPVDAARAIWRAVRSERGTVRVTDVLAAIGMVLDRLERTTE